MGISSAYSGNACILVATNKFQMYLKATVLEKLLDCKEQVGVGLCQFNQKSGIESMNCWLTIACNVAWWLSQWWLPKRKCVQEAHESHQLAPKSTMVFCCARCEAWACQSICLVGPFNNPGSHPAAISERAVTHCIPLSIPKFRMEVSNCSIHLELNFHSLAKVQLMQHWIISSASWAGEE